MILLTNAGAAVAVQLLVGAATWAELVDELRMFPIKEQPPIDRRKIAISDYVIAGSDVSPEFRVMDADDTSAPTLIGGREVIQWGPPGYTFTTVVPYTCFGYIAVATDDRVLWLDRFDTPIDTQHDGVVNMVPSIAMTSEYPPLGGGG